MCAHQFELSMEALDFYRRLLSLSEKKVVIVSIEELHFYRSNGHTFLLEGSSDCFYRRSIPQSRERLQLFRDNLSFLYRTVRFTQNTTIFFKEGWHNFKEIVPFLLGSDVPSGPPYSII